MIKNILSIIICTHTLRSKEARMKLQELENVCNDCFEDYEIILVNDVVGPNNSFINDMLIDFTHLRVIDIVIQKNFSLSYTIGLEASIGDIVIMFNPLIDPLSIINSSIQKILGSGNELSYIVGRNEMYSSSMLETKFLRLTSYLAGTTFVENLTSYRVISRRQLKAMFEMTTQRHELFTRLQKVGFSPIYHDYKLEQIVEESTRKKILNIISIFLEDSRRVLRGLSILGFVASLISFSFGCYAILSRFMRDDIIEGWTSTMCVLSFLFTIQFILIVFLGEAISNIPLSLHKTNRSLILGERLSNKLSHVDNVNVTSST